MALMLSTEIIPTTSGSVGAIPENQISKLTGQGYLPTEARNLIQEARNYSQTRRIPFNVALDITCEAYDVKKSGSIFFNKNGRVHTFNLGQMYVSFAMGDDHTVTSLQELHRLYLDMMRHERTEEARSNREFQLAVLDLGRDPNQKPQNPIKQVDPQILKKSINALILNKKPQNPGNTSIQKVAKEQIKENTNALLESFNKKITGRSNNISN